MKTVILISAFIFFTVNLFSQNNDTNLYIKKTAGVFDNAVSVTNDGKGFLYVLDNENAEIIKFSSEFEEMIRTGKKGWNNGEFFSPTHIDASNGTNIFVSDKLNSRIQNFDLNLGFVSVLLTDSEIIENQFKIRKPVCSVPVNSSDLYVVDYDNPKVVLFLNAVTPVSYFGSYQSVNGALLEPVKIVKDSRNNIFIFDKKKQSVFRYDYYGNYISEFKINGIISVTTFNNLLYILTEKNIFVYDVVKGAYAQNLQLPSELGKNDITDITVTGKDKIYILKRNKIFLLTK